MRKVTATTAQVFTAAQGTAMTFEDVTVLTVQMGSAQLQSWNWLGDEDGRHPMSGFEVRDTTGALLGVVLSVGWLDGFTHAEYYDPATDDFFSAGEGDQVATQGIARVLEAYGRNVAAVPSGEGFTINEPLYRWTRSDCYAGLCPESCPLCEADHHQREADRLAWAA